MKSHTVKRLDFLFQILMTFLGLLIFPEIGFANKVPKTGHEWKYVNPYSPNKQQEAYKDSISRKEADGSPVYYAIDVMGCGHDFESAVEEAKYLACLYFSKQVSCTDLFNNRDADSDNGQYPTLEYVSKAVGDSSEISSLMFHSSEADYYVLTTSVAHYTYHCEYQGNRTDCIIQKSPNVDDRFLSSAETILPRYRNSGQRYEFRVIYLVRMDELKHFTLLFDGTYSVPKQYHTVYVPGRDDVEHSPSSQRKSKKAARKLQKELDAILK